MAPEARSRGSSAWLSQDTHCWHLAALREEWPQEVLWLMASLDVSANSWLQPPDTLVRKPSRCTQPRLQPTITTRKTLSEGCPAEPRPPLEL